MRCMKHDSWNTYSIDYLQVSKSGANKWKVPADLQTHGILHCNALQTGLCLPSPVSSQMPVMSWVQLIAFKSGTRRRMQAQTALVGTESHVSLPALIPIRYTINFRKKCQQALLIVHWQQQKWWCVESLLDNDKQDRYKKAWLKQSTVDSRRGTGNKNLAQLCAVH